MFNRLKAEEVGAAAVGSDTTTELERFSDNSTVGVGHHLNDPIGVSHSLTHSLTHSPTYSPTYSLTFLLTHLLTHSPSYSLTFLLTHSLTYSLTHLCR